MCGRSSKSAEIADLGGKGTTTCEQSTISHGQTYELIRLNLLSLIVGFDRIDGGQDKDNQSTFKVNRSIHV